MYMVVNNGSTQTNQPSEKTAIPQATDEKYDDRVMDNAYKLHGKLLAFNISSGHYPAATTIGWQEFIKGDNDPLIDPYTSKEYTFTIKAPEYGEVEYRYPASCDKERKEFVPANSPQSYAFRMKYSDGVRCTHSL